MYSDTYFIPLLGRREEEKFQKKKNVGLETNPTNF